LWSPADSKTAIDSAKCHLGRHTTYTRRKREAECYNPANYQPLVSSVNCPCIREDYECDACYELASNGSCINVCDSFDPNSVPENCNGFYYITKGYQQVPGDTCDPNAQGALNLMPIKTACPGNQGSSSTHTPRSQDNAVKIIVSIFVIVLIVAAVIISAYVVRKTKKPTFLYNLFDKLKAPTPAAVDAKYTRLNMDDSDEEEQTIVIGGSKLAEDEEESQ